MVIFHTSSTRKGNIHRTRVGLPVRRNEVAELVFVWVGWAPDVSWPLRPMAVGDGGSNVEVPVAVPVAEAALVSVAVAMLLFPVLVLVRLANPASCQYWGIHEKSEGGH